ncbi:cyclic nucleotide-binding protein [Aromatoleum toluvorans]|uniref:Cyclic nucleotide-binding protein n=1 Tax=Aromatoleum toluvorans TaxID=92002 RepID=A0ABX1Q0V1_9RHOO|nr:cyclic nucleotide-binding protein [Aromatoleum toluvorans]NMG44139.1 cyclic nucleotide-binding protein [Aromatoleum toluvorans]
MTPSDFVGLIGVIACLVAYAGLQVGRLRHDDLRYLGLNILSPACLLFSLMYDFNLAAVITQVLWLGLSFIGLVRALYARGRKTSRTTAKCAENGT